MARFEVEAFRAAAQDHRVAGFEAEAARVGGDVGAALINDADHAERHADARDLEAVRAAPRRDDFANRVGKSRNLVQPARHRLDARVVQREAIHEGLRAACVARRFPVGGVHAEDVLSAGAQSGGGGAERVVLLPRGRKGQRAGGRLGLRADGEKRRSQRAAIGGVRNERQRHDAYQCLRYGLDKCR